MSAARGEPLLSLVTVCRNAARTIGDTFASVRAQRGPEVEYVVIDGGSDDGTVELIRREAGIIDAWVSEPDRGIFDAMNKGARRSTGRNLWFLNADDRLEPGALSEVLDRLRDAAGDGAREGGREGGSVGAGEGGVILAGRTRRVDDDGTTLAIDRHVAPGTRAGEPAHTFAHPSTIMPRALFDRLGGFDPSLRIAGDYDLLWRAMSLHTPVIELDRVLTVMRAGGVSSGDAPLAMRVRHELEVIAVQRRHAGVAAAARGHLVRLGRLLGARAAAPGGSAR
ncbi:MAG: glycosyltransferase family 2 protein [Burkholderiales bacterium]|nr:glycosyltransferase family 2 protein [Burkholderiales bacterium]